MSYDILDGFASGRRGALTAAAEWLRECESWEDIRSLQRWLDSEVERLSEGGEKAKDLAEPTRAT